MNLWREHIKKELQPDPNRYQDSSSYLLALRIASILIGHPVKGTLLCQEL
jgi:hypothetical protein